MLCVCRVTSNWDVGKVKDAFTNTNIIAFKRKILICHFSFSTKKYMILLFFFVWKIIELFILKLP